MRRIPDRVPGLAVEGAQGLSQQTAGSFAKVAIATVNVDTAGWWDASALRYIPQRPGLYLVTISFSATVAINDQLLADVCAAKNGTADVRAFSRWVASGSSYGPISSASGLIPMNGTTDYLEAFGGSNRSGGCAGTMYLGVALMS